MNRHDDMVPVLFYALLPAFLASLMFNVWSYICRPDARKVQISPQVQAQELPVGWWTDESRFQTERRAIFSQTWICVTHRGRFTKAGDYISTEIAGFRIFLILGKDGVVRAFHNVCRHRAYPVTKKTQGSSLVLGCGYHGWSYNTTGQLTKAPHFDNVPGFSKEENSLWEINTKTDNAGFVHVNFDRGQDSGRSAVPRAVKNGRPVLIYQTSQYLYSWEFKGNFNWKIAVAHIDNHDIREDSLLIETGIVASPKSTSVPAINHMSQLRFGFTTSIYTKRGSPFWFLVSYSPDAAGRTTLRCEAYTVRKQGSPFDEDLKKSWGEELKSKVQELERNYRKACRDGSSRSSSDYNQSLIAEQVDVHLKKEEAQGKEIAPAAVQSKNAGSLEAERLCQAVECAAGGKLDW